MTSRQTATIPPEARYGTDLDSSSADDQGSRDRLLEGLPIVERQVEAAGIPTSVLEGGEGPPILLLHGPGESAVNWRWVIPGLTADHHVIAPDLPAHGSTSEPDRDRVADHVLAWLSELIERLSPSPPVLVGHVLGGAIGIRLALARPGRLRHLVLVDSLGLARFRPSPRFAIGFAGFAAKPTGRSYERFMRQCAFDLDSLRSRMGEDWEVFATYNLELARAEKAKAAGKVFRAMGLPRLPAEELARLEVPTSLIWGRHDRANRLRVAEAASERYGWPLHVVDEAADDPARDQPERFLGALRAALGAPREEKPAAVDGP